MAKSFQNPVVQQVMPFNYDETHEVKTILINDAPYFVAKDVCNILGLDDTNKALLKLDNDEKLTRKFFVSGQNREVWLINESGLYTLILRSNKPEAKRFRKWVTSEVLPSIRKTGQYVTPSVFEPSQGIYPPINKAINLKGYWGVKASDLFRALGIEGDVYDLMWDIWNFAQNETKSYMPIMEGSKIVDYWVSTWEAELFARYQHTAQGWALAKYFREDESPAKVQRPQRISHSRNHLSITVSINQ